MIIPAYIAIQMSYIKKTYCKALYFQNRRQKSRPEVENISALNSVVQNTFSHKIRELFKNV